MAVEEKSSARSEAARGRLLVLATAVLWSLAGVFIKSLDLHPLTIVFYRSLFAGLFFAPLVKRGVWSFTPPIFISMLSYTAAISSFVSANKLTTAANAIVLQYTAPIFVFVFARMLFREVISKLNLVTLAAGSLGVVIIFAGTGKPEMAGVGVAIVSGLCFAVYITNLRYLRNLDPRYVTLANNVACCAAVFPWVRSQLGLTAIEAMLLAVMGVIQLGIPYFLFSRGIEKISLQEASLILLIEPVLNPIWVAAAFGEVPSGATLVGGGVILASLGARYAMPRSREF